MNDPIPQSIEHFSRRDRLSFDDLGDLEIGSRLLGRGGGGSTRVGRALADRAMKEDLVLLDCEALARLGDESWVIPIGIMGASNAVLAEFLPNGHEFNTVVERLESTTGARATAIVSIEVGGVNALIAVAAAASLHLPLMDADLSGGAVPRLDQMSNSAWGTSIVPAVLVDGVGRVLTLDERSGHPLDPCTLERVARSFVGVCGGWAAIGFRPILRGDATRLLVWGGISRAIELGRAHAKTKKWEQFDPEQGSKILAVGQVLALQQPRLGGQPGGWCLIQSLGGELCRLDMQTEYLVFTVDGRREAAVPDILVVLDRRSGIALSTENLRVGLEVVILRLLPATFPSDSRLQHAVGLSGYGLEP